MPKSKKNSNKNNAVADASPTAEDQQPQVDTPLDEEEEEQRGGGDETEHSPASSAAAEAAVVETMAAAPASNATPPPAFTGEHRTPAAPAAAAAAAAAVAASPGSALGVGLLTSTPRSASGRSSSVGPHGTPHIPLVILNPEAEDKGNIHLSAYEALNDPMTNLTYALSTWNKIKLYVIGPFVIPAKLFGVVSILSAGAAVGMIAQMGLRAPSKRKRATTTAAVGGGNNRPAAAAAGSSSSHNHTAAASASAPSGRKPLKGIRRFIASGIFTLARGLLFAYGFYYIKVTGKPDPKATVIVANHSGPFEATAILHFSRATVVSRLENSYVPLLGSILKSLQCIFVNRNSVESRDDTIDQIKERAASPPGTWPPLLIFPEGTTGNNKSIMRFRTGAFLPGVPVQPIVAKFRYKWMDPTWCDDRIGMGALMMRVLSQFYNTLELQYLPTYYPSEAEKADAVLYAENVRQYMCAHSGLPASQYSLDDYFVLAEALKYNIPQSEALLGMEMLRKEANITAMDVKKIIRAFGELDTSKKGMIGYGPFLRYLGMPDTIVTRTIFAEVMATNSLEEDSSRDTSRNSSFALDGGNAPKSVTSGPSSASTNPTAVSPCVGAAAAAAVVGRSPRLGAHAHSSDAVYELLDETDFTASLSDNTSAARAITFRQFLRAIIKINKNISTEDKITQAFDIVNFTGTGKITKEEMLVLMDFAAKEMTEHQAKDLYNKMDSRRMGFIDRIEFGAFMRANPIYLATFEAARQYEREKDLNNPVIRALEAKARKEPITVEGFRKMVAEYREELKAAGEESIMYF